MEILKAFFDIHSNLVTIAGYNLSYLEFVGTIFTLWSVILVSRNNIWTWAIGNIGAVLFAVLFFQIHLYADFIEQIYFFVSGCFGWFIWNKRSKSKTESVNISYSSLHQNVLTGVSTVFGTVALTYLTIKLPTILPAFFQAPASYPLLDSFTTIMSFVATILMAYKKIECWYLWILVDIIGIWLYFVKGVVFISGLYVIFLILATYGFVNWYKLYKSEKIA